MVLFFKRALTAVLFLIAVLARPQPMQGQALTITTLAGTDGGPGFEDGSSGAARFYIPAAIATDKTGNIYVADSENHTIRKITPAGAVTTLAGLAGKSGSTDGTGSAARFDHPAGVAVDSRGDV
jgi:DNA-binding beta-propeller fold protein YncE